MPVIMDPDCAAGKHTNCDGTGWDEETEALADCPCSCHTHVTDAEVEAFKAAWRVAGEKIGRGIAEPGTKTRAGLRAAFAAREAAEAAASEPCREELPSWSYFTSQQVDSYWMRCHELGPHEEHKNSETGAHWRTSNHTTKETNA